MRRRLFSISTIFILFLSIVFEMPLDTNQAEALAQGALEERADVPLQQDTYLKASNTDAGDGFGTSVAIDGDTIVIGATWEDSDADIINGDQNDNSASGAGAAYVFVRENGSWRQQAYLKASNSDGGDYFGSSVAIDGNTIVVGAPGEDSNAHVIYGDQNDNSASDAGAAYVFVRSEGQWHQQAYLKASNAEAGDGFGLSVAIDGDTIVVGADGEGSKAVVIDGDQNDNSALGAGAAYVFVRSSGQWSQQAYLKANNTEENDYFGESLAIAGDVIVVGAYAEDSNSILDPSNNLASDAGAAYIFTRTSGVWNGPIYWKASNAEEYDYFGMSVSISNNLVVAGAFAEDSNAHGFGGDPTDNSATGSGAAYFMQYTQSNGSFDFSYAIENYLKASNTEADDSFGHAVAVDDATIVIGASFEDSNARGINGDQNNNSASDSGAVYVFSFYNVIFLPLVLK